MLIILPWFPSYRRYRVASKTDPKSLTNNRYRPRVSRCRVEDSEADGCECELFPGIDEGGVAVIADAHATQALDPADGAFDGPAVTAQVRTVRSVAVTDGGVDAASRQRLASGLAVVSGIGKEQVWRPTGASGQTANRGIRRHGGQDFLMITGVRGRAAKHQRSPSQVGEQCQLCPGFSAVNGAGAAAIATAERSHVSRVDQHDTLTQTAALTEQSQQSEMHTLPHTEFLPQLQASPCSFTTATEFPRDVLPATADRQHKPDHFQHDRMRDRWPPALPPRRLLRRQQRHDRLAKRIRQAGIHDSLLP